VAQSKGKEDILRAIREAPLLSPNTSLLLQKTSEPDHDLQDVIRIVKFDSVLTARLLRIVNSAAFSTVHPITSVDRAVAYLGEKMVVGAALADSVSRLFLKPLSGYEGGRGELWRHDLFTALAAREIVRTSRSALSADLAFTGGLLHDIGKAILSDFLHDTSRVAVAGIENGELVDYLAAEQESAGLTHAEVGHELAKHWKLPASLQEVILHHHHPGQAGESVRALVYAVHLGDIVAMMAGCGTGSDTMQYHLDVGYERYFDLTPDALALVLVAVQEEFVKAEEAFALA